MFDLDAPSLIFGEMPVKYVQLVHGEDVDETLHLVYGPEMTPGVEHSAAVCEAGFVADDDRGYCSVGSDELGRECLQGVEHGLRGSSENFDGTGRHGKSAPRRRGTGMSGDGFRPSRPRVFRAR